MLSDHLLSTRSPVKDSTYIMSFNNNPIRYFYYPILQMRKNRADGVPLAIPNSTIYITSDVSSSSSNVFLPYIQS